MYKNFEDYLMEQCIKENPHILDDMLPDYYEQWKDEMDIEIIFLYADKYGIEKKLEGTKEMSKQLISIIKEI